jgi:hypothetical protein
MQHKGNTERGIIMLNIMGKQAMELKVIKNERPKLKEQWCDEQQRDCNRMFEMVEELITAASVAHHSPMTYQQLQQAKAEFIKEFLDTSANYRMIEDPTDYRKEMRA